MRISIAFNGLACGALLVLAGPALSQTQRSGGGSEAQKFMQQYQQIAAEKTALQGQLAQSKKDLEAANAQIAQLNAQMKKERDAAKAHVGVSPALLAQATTGKETAERNLEKSKQQTAEVVTKFREMAGNLREVEADRTKLRDEMTKRNTAFDSCAANNQQLYDLLTESLDRYEHVGAFTRVSASEPFTRITRTRMENLVLETRQRAEQLRVKKATP